jgi:predicted MPP superfamily phosphohydrolase
MKWLGEKPFHTFLLLTEKPGQWAAWKLVPIPLALAAVAGLLWATVVQEPGWGWAVALGLLALALVDWGLLATLPRAGLSYGPVQPPWLGLTLLRWLIALAAGPFGARWLLPALFVLALVQLLGSVLLVYGTRVEPFRIEITQVELASTKLADPGQPVRLLHLSDIHVERLTRREDKLAVIISELSPDVIVVTGDFLNTSYNDDPRALADLRRLLSRFHAPGGIYGVWGTAEVDRPSVLRPVLRDLGVVLLDDQAVAMTIQGRLLWLMGVSCTRDVGADAARLRDLLGEAPPDAFTLFLYHLPDLMPEAASLGVDLYLAGHTHGGQWRLPGFGAILTSSRYWKRYESGGYREGNTYLYVSRGLGMEGFGAPRARFLCPPEVVLITLDGAGGNG